MQLQCVSAVHCFVDRQRYRNPAVAFIELADNAILQSRTTPARGYVAARVFYLAGAGTVSFTVRSVAVGLRVIGSDQLAVRILQSPPTPSRQN